MTQFFIQASCPIIRSGLSADEETLRDAIEDVFPMDTEDAFLNWNGVSVALSYKYDVSVMIDDLLMTLEALTSSIDGEIEVDWPSNTFRASWRLSWAEGHLTGHAEWESVSGNLEKILSDTGGIELSRDDFVAEWMAPLERVVKGLRAVGYQAHSLRGLGQMERLLAQRVTCGRLYRGQEPL